MNKKITASIVILALVASFFVGSYAATGNWNPWGSRHYYVTLNANVQECLTNAAGTTCQEQHNVNFNVGMDWLQVQFSNGNPAAGGSMHFIALSNTGGTILATDPASGATTGQCGGALAAELTTLGAARTAGSVTQPSGSSPRIQTVAATFTATGAGFTAQRGCLMNQLGPPPSANDVQFAASTFTSVTLAAGDSLTVTWSITWSF